MSYAGKDRGANVSMVPCRLMSLGLMLTCGLALVGAVSCGDDGDSPSNGKIRVSASLEIFADMVRNVAGERADVSSLLPSGADPHTYEPSPASVADVVRADLVFVNGLGLEGNLRDVIDENAGGPVVELSQGLPTINDNPHLWLDARRAAGYVEAIRDALIGLDPGGRSEYQSNGDAYLAALDQLNQEFAATINAIPANRRVLVTFHDAYPYLAERYGLEIAAVAVTSVGKEPSARDIADLVAAIIDVPAVYKEPQFSGEVLTLAAEDAGVPVLDLLSDAYADGVDSYIGLMQFNLEQLKIGLGDE